MPLSELVKRILQTDDSRPRALVLSSFLAALNADDRNERTNAQRLIDWYERDHEPIIKHLKDAATKTFGNRTNNWQWPIVNPVPRTIRRLSLSYKEAPKREYYRGEKKLLDNSDDMKKIERMYTLVDRDRKFTELERYATLLNTAHMEIVPRKGAIDWDLKLRPIVSVIVDPDDFLNFAKFIYRYDFVDPETRVRKKGWVYWSDEFHYAVPEGGGDAIAFEGEPEDLTNPYRDENGDPVIPIVTARKTEQNEYWGQFGADIVEAAEQLNIQLAQAWHSAFFQSFGVPFGVNLGISDGSVLELSPEVPITVDNVDKGMVPPSLEFIKTTLDTGQLRELVDWFLKLNSSGYGMPPTAWADEERELSGFAKMLDNIELLEQRAEEIKQWERTEIDADKKSRIVYNYFANESDRIPPDIELRITFPKIEIPRSQLEVAQEWSLLVAGRIKSPIDYYLEEEGLTEDEIVEKFRRRAALEKRAGIDGGREPVMPPAPDRSQRANEPGGEQ